LAVSSMIMNTSRAPDRRLPHGTGWWVELLVDAARGRSAERYRPLLRQQPQYGRGVGSKSTFPRRGAPLLGARRPLSMERLTTTGRYLFLVPEPVRHGAFRPRRSLPSTDASPGSLFHLYSPPEMSSAWHVTRQICVRENRGQAGPE
jgi:hypothetical protein